MMLMPSFSSVFFLQVLSDRKCESRRNWRPIPQSPSSFAASSLTQVAEQNSHRYRGIDLWICHPEISVLSSVHIFLLLLFSVFLFNNRTLPSNLFVLVLSALHDNCFFYMHNAASLKVVVSFRECQRRAQARTQTHPTCFH